MRSLRASLADEPLPRLMAMADLWDASVEATTIREVAEALAAHILVESNFRRERDGLPDDARAALAALVQTGGRMPLAAFERRFGAIRPMGPGKLERERPWLSPDNAAEVLWYRGFVFRAFDSKGTPVEMAFVPADALEVLSDEVRVANEDRGIVGPATPRSTLAIRHSALLDDVVTLLYHIQNGDVKLKANGEWDAAAHRVLLPMLKIEDEPRIEFLLHLIERVGFTRAADGKLRLIPQPVTHWLQSEPQAQRDVLYEAWLNDETWNDLAHVEGISLQMTHAWANEPVRERRAIVDLWSEWHARELKIENGKLKKTDHPLSQFSIFNFQFLEHVKSTAPDFARVDGRYDTWHVRDEATGEFLHGFENWERVEGALIRYVVEKPLRWLALAEDDKQDREARPSTSALSSPSPASFLSISAAGRVTLPATHRFERFQLARVADWVETGADAYGYVLTARSLARAREQGIRPQRVIEFLEQTSAKPLPDGLRNAIVRWGERGVEARMEPMIILKTQDAAAMESLLRVQTVRRAVVDRFAPNCISVRQRDAEAVRAAIVESGLMVDGLQRSN